MHTYKPAPTDSFNFEITVLKTYFQTEETKYINGKFISKIKIAPEENITLTCIAENLLERAVTSLNVSASKYVSLFLIY